MYGARGYRVHQRLEAAQLPQELLAALERAGVADADHQDGAPVECLGDQRQRRRLPQVDDRRQLVGCRGREVAVAAQHLGSVLEREVHRAGEHGPELVQAVLERRHDAEVAAAPAQRPEQVGPLVLAGSDLLAVDGDEVRRQQVVDDRAVLAHQPADAAAEREPGDSGVGDDPAHGRQAVRLPWRRRARPTGPRRRRARCGHAGRPRSLGAATGRSRRRRRTPTAR